MTTAIYVRLNKHHDDGGSLVTQERDCRRYAEFKEWNNVEVYAENGISAGRSGDHRRKEFKRLERDIEAGRIDHVLFWKVDRCYRIASGLLNFVELCRERNVDLVFTTQGIDTSIKGTGNLLITILGAIAEAEAEIRKDRQVAHRERMKEQGRKRSGGFRRYGYEPDNVTLRPAEVALIRDSAAQIIAGDSLRSVAVRWAEAGVKDAKGKPPYPQSIRRNLLNTDLVDPETHERLVAILEDPARRTGGFNRRSYLLTGLVHCTLCGERMVAHPSGKVRRYRCRESVSDRTKGCGQTSIRADLIEGTVVDLLRTGLAQGTFAEQFRGVGGSVDVEAIAGERARLDAKLAMFTDMLANDEIDRPEYKRKRQEIHAEQDRLSQRIRDGGGAGPDAEALYAQWKRYETPDHSREAFDWWRSLVENVVADIRVTPPSETRKGDVHIQTAGGKVVAWWWKLTMDKLEAKPHPGVEVTRTKA